VPLGHWLALALPPLGVALPSALRDCEGEVENVAVTQAVAESLGVAPAAKEGLGLGL
jgi:hypothetical protein